MATVTGGTSLVDEASKFLGTPYIWGGATPKGFDCSGLVQYALERLGLRNVPRTSEAQWAWVKRISRSQLRPGDLIFEQWPGEAWRCCSAACGSGPRGSGRTRAPRPKMPQRRPGTRCHDGARPWRPGPR
jgi:cell wall-associated NlpC family hydrolase